jgi:hypothetical protein
VPCRAVHQVDQIYHLACPASPPHYQYNPIKTIKTSTQGTINMLGLARRTKARLLLASTSEAGGVWLAQRMPVGLKHILLSNESEVGARIPIERKPMKIGWTHYLLLCDLNDDGLLPCCARRSMATPRLIRRRRRTGAMSIPLGV